MTTELKQHITQINERLTQMKFGDRPTELYEPIRYIMSLGGKRIRPLLVLMAYNLFRDDAEKILDQAIAMEVFHNFTLMHDDIMDSAPLRRGKPTVHEKWNSNVAILSGDVAFVKSYTLLIQSPSGDLKQILDRFSNCALEVCEGQQFDMNFETMTSVSENDYLDMIRLKTAVLLGFSLQLGAMLADTSEDQVQLLDNFGCNIGVGFQLMDDLLDVYGDQEKFGKQVGGDIIANKKTFLLLKALELANEKQKSELQHWLGAVSFNKLDKVEAVTRIYDEIGIKKLTEAKMNDYFDQGFASLKALEVDESRKQPLIDFTNYLINREH